MKSKIIDVIKLLSAATGQRKSCGGAMSARTLSLFTSKAAKMLLVGCLLTCGIFFSAVAQTVTQGGLTYTLNTDGYTASVSGYNAATLTAQCTILATVTYNDAVYTVTAIGNSAFYNCTGLTSVTFADGSWLDTIGEYAFYGCSSLSTIAFPASLKVIKKRAFYNSGLTSITLGAELDSVGNFAFYGCNALTTVQWNSPNLKYTNNSGQYLFANNTSIQSVTFGSTVEVVPYGAFRNCTGLTTVSFAEGSQLDTIGEYAFYGCSSLSTIALPASLKVIKEDAFSYSGLTSITLGAELDSVGNFAFYGCNALTTVQWNSPNLKYTNNSGQYLFANNTSIQSVTFGSTVEVVPYGAFRNCTGLTTVSFADGSQLDTIGERAFEGCSSLSTIALPASLKYIDSYAFGYTGLTSITTAAQVPPTMGTDVWAEVPTTAVVTVPCGTLSVYRNDTDWGNEFSDIREDVPYSITVTSTNEAMGTATMGDILCSGIELTATANCGYRFTQWSNGVTENPYTVVLTKDTALTAIFEAYTISGTDVITACDSYTWIDGVTYTSSNNTAQYTLTNAAGCDSVVTLNLTINHSVYDTIVDTAINEYTWNGEIYTQSGVYEYVAQTATGCDSIVVLILTIQNIGVEVPDMLDNLKFYPNPAQSIITFNTEDIVKVEVLDGMGRMVAVFENSYRIDISQLVKGYYTMRITTSKGITIRRVVKQ